MKNNSRWKCAILLAGMSALSAEAVTSGPEARPRPENFPSYSLYLQALFDFQRAQGHAATRTETAIGESPALENLDTAIANAGNGPGHIDSSKNPRSTFKSFALSQIPAQDLSQTGVENALGIFGNHNLEQPPETTARLRPDNALSLTPDVSLRLIGDAYDIRWANTSSSAVTMASEYIVLPEGEAYTSASVVTSSDSGLDLTLSTKVRSNIYIIDRDGIPNTSFSNAGAVSVQPLSLQISNLTSHITASNSRNSEYISIEAGSPDAIYVDLSGSRLGAADADESQGNIALSSSRVGRISYFASFGQNALLTIAPGMSLSINLQHKHEANAPLVTISGRVPDISLADISLLGTDNGGNSSDAGLHIGRLNITGINLVDMRVYVESSTVILDMGRGIRNMAVSLERVSMGSNATAAPVGDFYTQNIGIANSRITIAAH